jgi:uncharacterized membrane protein YjjB (DUF3815 family)
MGMIIQAALAGLATLGFSVVFNIHGKKTVPAVIGGMLGWLLYLLAFKATGSKAISSLLASTFIGFYAEGAAKLFREPASIFILPAIHPPRAGAACTTPWRRPFRG